MFGFRPTIFVAPGCSFDNVSELTASDNNILYIETYLGHIMALDNKKKPILRCCHWGEKLAGSLISLIRNAHYEPAWQKSGRWGESDEKGITASQKFALIEIKRAFRRGEPCILSTHAQNYIGNHEKASLSLQGLGVILKKVVSRWPDVRYVSAEKLGALISGDKVDGNLKVNLYSKSKARKPQLVSSLFWTAYEFFFIMYVTRNSVPKTII